MGKSGDSKVKESNEFSGAEDYEIVNKETNNIDIKITNESESNSRDIEKQEALNKQRENYLNKDIRSNNVVNSGQEEDIFKKLRNSFDSGNEYLYYMLGIELFFIFLTYSHYQYFDNKNKFLTPIVMGSETSLLGKTLILLYKCYKTPNPNTKWYKADDEENNIVLSNLNIASKTGGNMHSRNSSNVDKISFPKLTPTLSTLDSDNAGHIIQDENIREHLKFMIWGGLNGLLSSYWIEFLVSLFPDMKLACVFVDQTIGTIIFQTLYSLFVCLWDWEIESLGLANLNEPLSSKNLELTWETFVENYSKVLWKYMKLSWMVWPVVSLCCFTLLPETWIFPVNCIFATLFSVVLGI